MRNFISFSPKIIHKGLALVIIPFLLNAIWVMLLSNSLAKEAELAEMESSQRDLLEHLNASVMLAVECSSDEVRYALSQDETLRQESIRTMTLLKRHMAEITAKRPDQIAFVTNVLNVLQSQLDQVEKFSKKTDAEPPGAFGFLTIRKDLEHLVIQGSAKTTELLRSLETEKEDLDKLSVKQKNSRAFTNQVVAFGILANLLLALLLAFFFIKDISGRLAVLVQNAQRLAKRQPLEPPVSGTDELSMLDQAIHLASDDLHKAFDFRASLMQMVAHDLRAPIAASQLSLEALADSEEDNLSATAVAHIDRIQSTNRTLLHLINDLLTIDALELGKLELELSAVPVRTLAAEAIDTLDTIAKLRKIEVLNLCGEESIYADGKRIIQVLTNYLSNALKFSKSNTKIQVTSERVRDWIVVSVIDQGKGMAAGTAKRAFDKFYRAAEERSTDGFGLGLAICKLIITSHGGAVGVDSELGKGSRFWFRVKAAPLRVAAIPSSSAAAP